MPHDYVACRARPSPGLGFRPKPNTNSSPQRGGGRTCHSSSLLLSLCLCLAWFVWQLVRGVFELCKSAKTRRNGLICRAPSIDVILSDLPSIGDVVFNEFFPLLSLSLSLGPISFPLVTSTLQIYVYIYLRYDST